MAKTVLIVEDDPLLACASAALIEDEFGYAPTTVESSSAAMPVVERGVDLALLDIEVADGVTFALAAKLRAQGTPVVFVSGSDPSRVPNDLAATPFLQKPVMPKQLLAAARQYL
ncbi:MAG: response regulator transcription factor [Pseudolabrys sp.]|nr:response regulator transcription factor [Pseudolabrys sp.]MBV9955259.1 response regulator transcription factor [Pseudolabrys sp.]